MYSLIKLRFSSLRHMWPQPNSAILCWSFCFIVPKTLNYLAFQSSDFDRTWWRLFQKCRSLFVLFFFFLSFGHCIVCCSSIYCLGPQQLPCKQQPYIKDIMIGTTNCRISDERKCTYSICRCCWNVATHKRKIHNWKIEISSFFLNPLWIRQSCICSILDFKLNDIHFFIPW